MKKAKDEFRYIIETRSELDVGSELDQLVAEEALDLVLIEKVIDGCVHRYYEDAYGDRDLICFKPSSQINDALEVIDKMSYRYQCKIKRVNRKYWKVNFYSDIDSGMIIESSDLCHAVCIAALSISGYDIGPRETTND